VSKFLAKHPDESSSQYWIKIIQISLLAIGMVVLYETVKWLWGKFIQKF